MIDRELKKRHPAEPWRWREDWAKRRIDHNHIPAGAGMLLFAFAWNGFLLFIYLMTRGNAPRPIVWLLAAFGLFGILMLWGGVRLLVLGLRYPRSALLLTNVPQRVGQRFTARFEAAAFPEGEIHATLVCRQKRTERATDTLWSEEKTIPPGAINRTLNGVSVTIEFQLPVDGKESRDIDSRNPLTWSLEVAIGDKHSPKMAASFLLPVFGGERAPEDEFENALEQIEDAEVRRKIRDELA